MSPVHAPDAPGRLGQPVEVMAMQTYLTALDQWVRFRKDELDELDAAALSSPRKDELTDDMTLSMALWKAVADRQQLLLAVWDSGRVLVPERERLATLVWGRLDATLDAAVVAKGTKATSGALAVSLPEACRLSDALAGQLRAATLPRPGRRRERRPGQGAARRPRAAARPGRSRARQQPTPRAAHLGRAGRARQGRHRAAPARRRRRRAARAPRERGRPLRARPHRRRRRTSRHPRPGRRRGRAARRPAGPLGRARPAGREVRRGRRPGTPVRRPRRRGARPGAGLAAAAVGVPPAAGTGGRRDEPRARVVRRRAGRPRRPQRPARRPHPQGLGPRPATATPS